MTETARQLIQRLERERGVMGDPQPKPEKKEPPANGNHRND